MAQQHRALFAQPLGQLTNGGSVIQTLACTQPTTLKMLTQFAVRNTAADAANTAAVNAMP
jgi:hypothetical protein